MGGMTSKHWEEMNELQQAEQRQQQQQQQSDSNQQTPVSPKSSLLSRIYFEEKIFLDNLHASVVHPYLSARLLINLVVKC